MYFMGFVLYVRTEDVLRPAGLFLVYEQEGVDFNVVQVDVDLAQNL